MAVVFPPAETARPATKVCDKCEQELPLDAFTRQPRNRDARSGECRPCREKRRHANERLGVGWDTASHSPDPAPAIRLREELTRARAAGGQFEDVWEFALDAALAILPSPSARYWWSEALLWARSAFELGFNRQPVPGALSAQVPLDLDPVDASQARR